MTDEAMSPMRRRMIEDMTIRKLAPKTQQGYIRIVKDFAAFLGRSPDMASFEDVRRFQLHIERQAVSRHARLDESLVAKRNSPLKFKPDVEQAAINAPFPSLF